MRATSPTEFWLKDLANFRAEYAKFLERKENVLAQEEEEEQPKTSKGKKRIAGRPKGKRSAGLVF